MSLSQRCKIIAAKRAILRNVLVHLKLRFRIWPQSGGASPTSRKKNVLILSVINRAVAAIECELKIVDMELAHPERFARPERRMPQAKWIGTISDLLELIIALSRTGLIKKPSGQDMTLSELAALFGKVFGMKFTDLYGRKSRLLTRKKNESPFLDKLVLRYREEVDKMGF